MQRLQSALKGTRTMEKKTEAKKKAYEKPVVVRYPLKPEEAVLGTCKTSSGAGSNGGTCITVNPCTQLGS
jgi:hypothetical protein